VLVATFLAFPGIAEHLTGLGESPADGCLGAVGDGSNVCGAETFKVSEDQNRPIGFRELKEYPLHLDRNFISTGRGRSGVIGEPFFGTRGEQGPATATLLATEVIAGEIDGQPEEPRAKSTRRVKLLQTLEGAKKRLLCQIRNCFAIGDESLDHLHDPTLVPQNELPEGIVITLASEVDEARFPTGIACRSSILNRGMQVKRVRVGHNDHAATPFSDYVRDRREQRWNKVPGEEVLRQIILNSCVFSQ
jgi:hypothetical protein